MTENVYRRIRTEAEFEGLVARGREAQSSCRTCGAVVAEDDWALHDQWHEPVSLVNEPYSPEWLAARAAGHRAQAEEILVQLLRYENVHPPVDEGAPCLHEAVEAVKKALSGKGDYQP